MKTTHVLFLMAILAAVALPATAQSPEPTPAPVVEPETPAPTEQPEEPAAPAQAQAPATPAEPPAPVTPVAAPPASPAPVPVTVPTTYFDKLKVVVKGKADVNGVIQLQFQPNGGEPTLINVNVIKKMKDKDIARDIWKELALAGGDAFKTKLSGTQITIKQSNKKSPTFALTIIGQSVTGVSVSTTR